jgi:hypothetical protein
VRKLFVTLSCGSVAVLPLLLLLQQAKAVPRYSTRYEQNCNLCHVNPTGGGMRSLYATQYLIPEEIAMKRPGEELLKSINPEITNNVTIGADFRTMHFYSDKDAHALNFFEMQADLYVAFQMDRLSLYYNRGMNQSYEAFGLAYVLPWDGYVKAGRFVPAYGVKFSDHTMFTREYLGFRPPNHTDVGVELGTYPGRFAFHLSALNGAPGRTFDDNTELEVAARGAYRFNVAGVAMTAGGSLRHNPRTGITQDAGGAFGSIMLGQRLFWVGEFDWLRNKPDGQDATNAIVTSNEFTYLVHKGVELEATFDYYDPDKDYQTGSEQRYGGGVFVFVSPFVGLEALVRRYDFTSGIAITDDDYTETVLQLHVLY